MISKEDRNIIREKIKEEIIVTIEKISALKELTKPISPENAIGRISRMDAINNKSVMEASLRNKISKRNKLKMALIQIEKEGFGSCLNCKKPINPKRLMFMPESTKCINCADRR